MSYISYEDQIARLNRIVRELEHLAELPEAMLLSRPAEGAWSIVETVEHMNKAYAPHYRERLEKALAESPLSGKAPTEFQAGWIARFFCNAMRPQDGKRRMKMRTLQKFRPERETGLDLQASFAAFFNHQVTLKAQILKARERDISGKKISSAIGPLVRFTVPEAFEFILAHEERHVLQCRETLEQIGHLNRIAKPFRDS